jgi:hypothetical protein
MKLHVLVCILPCVVLAAAAVCPARPVPAWSYEKLVAGADLVVIATATAARDTKEPAVLPGVSRAGADGKLAPVPAVGVETTFKVEAVLKGEAKDLKEFVVYHLREPDAQAQAVAVNGPMLVKFDVEARHKYLLFLKRGAGGRYVPVTGQTDPAIGVKDLGTYP